MKLFQKKLSDLTIPDVMVFSGIVSLIYIPIMWAWMILPDKIQERKEKKEEES